MPAQLIRDRRRAAPQWPSLDATRIDPASRVRAGSPHARRATLARFFSEAGCTVGGDYVAIGTLPLDDPFFTDADDCGSDPLLLAELTRQGVEAIADLLLETPHDHCFVLKNVRLDTVAGGGPAAGAAGREVIVLLPRRQVRRKGALAYAADGPFYCYVGGRPAAQYAGTVAFIERAAYVQLRGGDDAAAPGLPVGHAAALAGDRVGKRRQENVLIGEAVASLALTSAAVVPQARPPYFDRPLDHYPGMFLAEAARQLAVHHAARQLDRPASAIGVAGIEMDFQSFAELHTAPVLHAHTHSQHGSSLTVEIVAMQAQAVRSRFVVQTHPKNVSKGTT